MHGSSVIILFTSFLLFWVNTVKMHVPLSEKIIYDGGVCHVIIKFIDGFVHNVIVRTILYRYLVHLCRMFVLGPYSLDHPSNWISNRRHPFRPRYKYFSIETHLYEFYINHSQYTGNVAQTP